MSKKKTTKKHEKIHVVRTAGSYTVRIERLDEVALHDVRISNLLREAQNLRHLWLKPLIYVYADEKHPSLLNIADLDSNTSNILDIIHKHIKPLLKAAALGEGLNGWQWEPRPIVFASASACLSSQSQTLGELIASCGHLYDETGLVFSDGCFHSGNLCWINMGTNTEGNERIDWFFLETPQTETEKQVFAQLSFGKVGDIFAHDMWYYVHFNDQTAEMILNALSMKHEDISLFSEYLKHTDPRIQSDIGVWDWEVLRIPESEPALRKLHGLPQRVKDLMVLWKTSFLNAAVCDFRDIDENKVEQIIALGCALGTDKFIEAYYAGVPIKDLIA